MHKITRPILITGATGFVGLGLITHLHEKRLPLRAAVRRENTEIEGISDYAIVGDLSVDTDWSTAVQGCEAVVHLAGRAHILREETNDPAPLFQAVNHHATVALAKAAIAAGVKRFIFVSSSHVHGLTSGNGALSAESPLMPETPYGQSKADAERSLRALCANGAMELVIIRPPLIYGPGVKGNFARLIKLVKSGMPLPFGLANNKRSLLGLDNLIDFISLCLTHPNAANQAFIIADAEVTSTKKLVTDMATIMNCRLFLLPIPLWLMRGVLRLLGKRAAMLAMFGNLLVDSRHATQQTGWQPPYRQKNLLMKLLQKA